MSETPNTDREQNILAAQIRAKATSDTMEEAGWRLLRQAEVERNYLVAKIERLENACSRMSETIKFYQGPKEKYCIEAVQHYEERNAEMLAMLKNIEKTRKTGVAIPWGLLNLGGLIKKVEGENGK